MSDSVEVKSEPAVPVVARVEGAEDEPKIEVTEGDPEVPKVDDKPAEAEPEGEARPAADEDDVPEVEAGPANAVAAAFRDPRFAPLTVEELPRTRVEVSLLTAPVPMRFTDEADALRQLRPHVDGIIFSVGNHRSTFLPQVWEQLPAPSQFMAHLKQKAGLPADYWSAEVELQRYEVRKWKEAPIP